MSRIRVLVVDDSAFARKVIREVLARDPQIEVVGSARDGVDALDKIHELRPDVVTLDLVMPDLDGLGVLRALPAESPPRVIIVSITPADGELAIEALQSGAVDLVTKPTPLATDRLYELSGELVAKVKDVAQATPRLGVVRGPPVPSPPPAAVTARLVVIGTSTGGPQALTSLFSRLPTGLPVPLAIALHIAAGYTAPLAARLSGLGGVHVREAEDGMELVPGEAVIAPGGQHLQVVARGTRLVAAVSREPHDAVYRPSVDLLFESAARAVGAAAVGIVLTGMGSDGLAGARALRGVGARVFAESARSCIVYGMPRSVIGAGLSDGEAPLERIPTVIVDAIYAGARAGGDAPRGGAA